jgi:hypothetical protein
MIAPLVLLAYYLIGACAVIAAMMAGLAVGGAWQAVGFGMVAFAAYGCGGNAIGKWAARRRASQPE